MSTDMSTEMKWLFNGQPISKEEAQQYAWMAVGYAPEKDVIYVFESDEAFLTWSKGTRFADNVSRMLGFASEARQLEGTDVRNAMERQRKVTSRIRRELRELSKRTGLEVGSNELLLKAMGKDRILEGPIFKSAVLFEHVDLGGRGFPLASGLLYPDFSWINFDNITTSLWVFGEVDLWQSPWFQGPAISFRSEALPPTNWDSIVVGNVGPFWNDTFSSGFTYVL
jgi:hypothetical protein